MPDQHDARFHAGIRLFNERDFFEAHEVWEDLWHEMTGNDRRFVQGLIQAAVCVYHAYNGNSRGANRLYDSASRYMGAYGSYHWGIDVSRFWQEMALAMVEFRAHSLSPQLQIALVPLLVYQPEVHKPLPE